MAISFKDKIAYVNKFADKADEKLQKVIKLSVNIESPKLNLTDAQKDKIKSSLQTAFERIKKIESEKVSAESIARKPNLNAVAKQIKDKEGITFEQARTKAKQAFAAKKKGQTNAIQSVLQDFKKKVGKIEYSRATRGTDIKRDIVRPALKAGKRKVITQGSTTNAYGTFKNKVGKVYYESRANRMDINQPSKKRYPKLANGGMATAQKVKIKDIPNLNIEENNFFDSENVSYMPQGSNVGRALGRVTNLRKNKYEAIQLVSKGVENKVGEYKTRKEALDSLLNSEIFDGSLSQVVSQLEKEIQDSEEEKDGVMARGDGGNVGGRKQILVQYDNGKKVLIPTMREAKSFIKILEANGHKNITLDGKTEYADGGEIKMGDLVRVVSENKSGFVANKIRHGKLYIIHFVNGDKNVYDKNDIEKIMTDGGEMADGGSPKGQEYHSGMLDYYDSRISSEPTDEDGNIIYPTFDDEYYAEGGGVKEKYTRPMYPTGSRALTHANLLANKRLLERRMYRAYSDYRFAIMDLVELKKDFYKGMARAENNYAKDSGEEYRKFEESLTYFFDNFGRRLEHGGAIKGSNPSTGEKFGVVIGSVEKEDGRTTLIVRSGYSSRIKSYELRFDEKGFLSAIGDFGSSTDGTYPDMKKGRLSVGNVDADNKKESIDAIAKITSPSFAKKVYDYVQEEKMAKGGLTEHGLKTGDTITDDMFWEDSIVVKNEKSGTRAKVNLNTGKRKEAKMANGGKMKYNRKK